MKVTGWDLAFWVIVAAILFSLVRPGSPAGIAVVALTDLAAATVGASTGYLFHPVKGGGK